MATMVLINFEIEKLLKNLNYLKVGIDGATKKWIRNELGKKT